jgi:hypothetical protein
VDTAFLLAGALAAATYFDDETTAENEVRVLADELYRRADWQWAQNGEATVTHGWKPESGFLPYRWKGYDEALLLYVLGLGSPTHPLPPETYAAFTSSYAWKKIYDEEYLYAGPLFIHQLSHAWIDFRGLQDNYMRSRGLDYFENSRRATYAQREYAIRNPQGYARYNDKCWGITASDGPGPITLTVDGVERVFFDYIARGAPYGPDDGTLAPWAVVASLPFAPEIVLPALHYFSEEVELERAESYGFKATFNPTYPHGDDESARRFLGRLAVSERQTSSGPTRRTTGRLRSVFARRGGPHQRRFRRARSGSSSRRARRAVPKRRRRDGLRSAPSEYPAQFPLEQDRRGCDAPVSRRGRTEGLARRQPGCPAGNGPGGVCGYRRAARQHPRGLAGNGLRDFLSARTSGGGISEARRCRTRAQGSSYRGL